MRSSGSRPPLLLPAGKGADPLGSQVGEAGFLEAAADFRRLAGCPFYGGDVVQEAGDGQLLVEAKILGQVTQAAFQRLLTFGEGNAVHQDFPLAGQELGHQQLHQGGLPRAVGPHQADEPGAFQGEAEALQRHMPAVALGEVANFYLHGGFSSVLADFSL